MQLPWDKPADAKAAVAAGWRIDEDDWWTRELKPNDIEIKEAAHFGFTIMPHEATQHGNVTGVWVRDATQALSYDKHVITPYKQGR